MTHMRSFRVIGLVFISFAISLTAVAQFGITRKAKAGAGDAGPAVSDSAMLIQNKMLEQFKLTKTTADRSDIVTAGDIVVLQKDGLMMCNTASTFAYANSYDNGVLTANQSVNGKAIAQAIAVSAAKSYFMSKVGMGSGLSGGAADAAHAAQAAQAKGTCTSRKFVGGEKFWVTGIVARNDGVVVSVFSDPYDNARFYGDILISFPVDPAAAAAAPAPDNAKMKKGAKASGASGPVARVVPSPDDFMRTMSEVITLDNANDQVAQPAPAPAAEVVAAALPAIPPPPPADQPPPTIEPGQSRDDVKAAFGQPLRMAKFGVKEIYFYTDMKVTFTNGKVSNVE